MPVAEPSTKRWMREEYYRMGELGWFQGQRVELIDGEIIEMSPHGNPHAVGIGLAQCVLSRVFGDDHWVRVQLPLRVGPQSEPEPDAAVVQGTPRDYTDHPTSALLVVEVADATLSYDTKRKTGLYASAGITDYWVVNLVDMCLEVYRQPVPDASTPFGHSYAEVKRLGGSERVTPLARPQLHILVSDLLP